jgi:hypothetical protein
MWTCSFLQAAVRQTLSDVRELELFFSGRWSPGIGNRRHDKLYIHNYKLQSGMSHHHNQVYKASMDRRSKFHFSNRIHNDCRQFLSKNQPTPQRITYLPAH